MLVLQLQISGYSQKFVLDDEQTKNNILVPKATICAFDRI